MLGFFKRSLVCQVWEETLKKLLDDQKGVTVKLNMDKAKGQKTSSLGHPRCLHFVPNVSNSNTSMFVHPLTPLIHRLRVCIQFSMMFHNGQTITLLKVLKLINSKYTESK